MRFRRTVFRLRSSQVALTVAVASAALVPAFAQAESEPPARELIERGTRLEHGEGVTRDLAAAHDLYCTAARTGSADGFLRLGWMYANGRGVERDDSIANTMFKRAAALGSELGGRLASTIRGKNERTPDCLTPRVATPRVDDPAPFRAARPGQQALVAMILDMARDYRLDPRLVMALIRVESGFNPDARSPKNAQGLMQLIPETAERFAVRDISDPAENLRGGMRYLRWLLSYFKGDVVLALAAYNAGEGAVDRWDGVPPYPETIAYVQRIRAFYPFDRHAFDPRVARQNPPTGPRNPAPGLHQTSAPDATARASSS